MNNFTQAQASQSFIHSDSSEIERTCNYRPVLIPNTQYPGKKHQIMAAQEPMQFQPVFPIGRVINNNSFRNDCSSLRDESELSYNSVIQSNKLMPDRQLLPGSLEQQSPVLNKALLSPRSLQFSTNPINLIGALSSPETFPFNHLCSPRPGLRSLNTHSMCQTNSVSHYLPKPANPTISKSSLTSQPPSNLSTSISPFHSASTGFQTQMRSVPLFKQPLLTKRGTNDLQPSVNKIKEIDCHFKQLKRVHNLLSTQTLQESNSDSLPKEPSLNQGVDDLVQPFHSSVETLVLRNSVRWSCPMSKPWSNEKEKKTVMGNIPIRQSGCPTTSRQDRQKERVSIVSKKRGRISPFFTPSSMAIKVGIGDLQESRKVNSKQSRPLPRGKSETVSSVSLTSVESSVAAGSLSLRDKGKNLGKLGVQSALLGRGPKCTICKNCGLVLEGSALVCQRCLKPLKKRDAIIAPPLIMDFESQPQDSNKLMSQMGPAKSKYFPEPEILVLSSDEDANIDDIKNNGVYLENKQPLVTPAESNVVQRHFKISEGSYIFEGNSNLGKSNFIKGYSNLSGKSNVIKGYSNSSGKSNVIKGYSNLSGKSNVIKETPNVSGKSYIIKRNSNLSGKNNVIKIKSKLSQESNVTHQKSNLSGDCSITKTDSVLPGESDISQGDSNLSGGGSSESFSSCHGIDFREEFVSASCNKISIGSLTVNPVNRVYFTKGCIYFSVPSVAQGEPPVALKISCDSIVKLLGNLEGDDPVLFLYIKPRASMSLKALLKMTNESGFNFDPTSKNPVEKRIIFQLNRVSSDTSTAITSFYSSKITMDNFPLLELLNKESTVKILKSALPQERNLTSKETFKGVSPSTVEIQALLTYPPPPNKGGITMTTDDYCCLEKEQFLNDVILDFYLKYLVLKKVSKEDRERTHVFSTFFYKRLTSKPKKVAGKCAEKTAGLSPAEKRHNRVKSWTKNIDIFKKDFIIIPINERSHWFLAVICFPGLDGPVSKKDGRPLSVRPQEARQKKGSKSRPRPAPKVLIEDLEWSDKDEAEGDDDMLGDEEEETQNRESSDGAIQRPCILVFDSLIGPDRSRIVATLRDYLMVEYSKKGTERRSFSCETMKGACPKVPQQTNFSDCGIFTLQYAESFFENPITDFSFPIRRLNNWFPLDLVARKREAIAAVIRQLMDSLRPNHGIELPQLNFAPDEESSQSEGSCEISDVRSKEKVSKSELKIQEEEITEIASSTASDLSRSSFMSKPIPKKRNNCPSEGIELCESPLSQVYPCNNKNFQKSIANRSITIIKYDVGKNDSFRIPSAKVRSSTPQSDNGNSCLEDPQDGEQVMVDEDIIFENEILRPTFCVARGKQ